MPTPSHAASSAQRYTTPAIILHWAIAGLFLASYAAVYYRRWFTEAKTPDNLTALQIHLAVGMTIGALVLLRVIWRLTHTPPSLPPMPANGPQWQHRAASIGHGLLYAFMIIMPITGYLGTGAATEYLGIPKVADTSLFNWLVVERLGLTFKEFEQPMDFIHKNCGAYLVWLLILGHVTAALYHQFHLRDEVMRRMWPSTR